MAEISQTRRRFIQFCAVVIGGFGLWRYLGANPKADAEILRVAQAEIPHQGAVVYADQRVAVLRRDDKLYALSLVCTHLGCTVQVNPDGLTCPCHGSRFNLAGEVLSGPAPRALSRLALSIQGETVEITLEGVS